MMTINAYVKIVCEACIVSETIKVESEHGIYICVHCGHRNRYEIVLEARVK